LNSGTAKFSISALDTYTPGGVLDITVSFSDSNTAKHGFELSALDAGNSQVGTFSVVDGNTQTSDGKYIKHTSAGSSQSGNASWNVRWTAPASGVQDPVTFYAAGNEADGNGTNQGDYIYTQTASLTAATLATPTPTATPSACEAESIELSDSVLELKINENGEITVTVTGAGECLVEGVTVTAKVNKAGKKRISMSSTSEVTDENGQAKFQITAGTKAGNAIVWFEVDGVKKKVIVKIRKK
jgi:hypothetical protein